LVKAAVLAAAPAQLGQDLGQQVFRAFQGVSDVLRGREHDLRGDVVLNAPRQVLQRPHYRIGRPAPRPGGAAAAFAPHRWHGLKERDQLGDVSDSRARFSPADSDARAADRIAPVEQESG
jgi:hypothetical protein